MITPFPLPPPNCTLDAVSERLLASILDRPRPEQEAIFQAIGRLFKAMHEVCMFDADFRDWSEAHRISPELERKVRLHFDEYKDFLQ
jgi:hypothetical protein